MTNTTFTATAKFDRLINEATDLFNAGFSSKAGQKRALENLSRAYNEVRDAWRNVQIAGAPHQNLDRLMTEAEALERHAYFYGEGSMDLPFDLHQIRDRHFPVLDSLLPGSADAVRQLVELRNTIKGAEIVPPAKDATKVRAAKVLVHLKDLMERRKAQFLEAIDLTEVLGDEGVIIHGLTASTHYVTNEHGTTFLRTFFYLRGKLTPLNSILAGAEEAARRAKEA